MEDSVAEGHQYRGRVYHLFRNDTCYAITYGVATAGWGAVDGMKRIQRTWIIKHLERILRTVQLPKDRETHGRSAPRG